MVVQSDTRKMAQIASMNILYTGAKVNLSEKECLIKLSRDTTQLSRFRRTTLSQVWISLENEYLSLCHKAITLLAHWLLGYDIFLPGNPPKTSFQLPNQQHSSSSDCTKELFKLSKDSASLHVCYEKQFLVLGFRFL